MLETNGLENKVSPHSVVDQQSLDFSDTILQSARAINEFLYVDSEPFITPEKTSNFKRMPFKKS